MASNGDYTLLCLENPLLGKNPVSGSLLHHESNIIPDIQAHGYACMLEFETPTPSCDLSVLLECP